MNKIIFLLTLSAAVTLSALAKADQMPRTVDVPTTAVQYEADSMMVKMTGNLPTQCVVSPRPSLSKTANKNVLVLSVIGSDFSENCSMVLGGNYQLAFDIRSLKFDLVELNLDPEATYKIISRDGSLAVSVPFGLSPLNLPYATSSLVGGVFAVESDGRPHIVVSSTESFEINSPLIDVAAYIGHHVEVQGHVVKARMPGVRLTSNAAAPTSILVTGISTTAF